MKNNMDGFIGISKMNNIQIPLVVVLFLCCELIAFLATSSKLLLQLILLPFHWNKTIQMKYTNHWFGLVQGPAGDFVLYSIVHCITV